jgi:hypothetical protein
LCDYGKGKPDSPRVIIGEEITKDFGADPEMGVDPGVFKGKITGCARAGRRLREAGFKVKCAKINYFPKKMPALKWPRNKGEGKKLKKIFWPTCKS